MEKVNEMMYAQNENENKKVKNIKSHQIKFWNEKYNNWYENFIRRIQNHI